MVFSLVGKEKGLKMDIKGKAALTWNGVIRCGPQERFRDEKVHEKPCKLLPEYFKAGVCQGRAKSSCI